MMKIAERPIPIKESILSRPIILQTNFLNVNLSIKREIFLYDVKFSPEIPAENIRQKKGLINKLSTQKELELLNPLIYNGTNLFSLKRMEEVLLKKVTDNIGAFDVCIQKVAVIDSSKISKASIDKKGAQAAQYILNIILKKMLNAAGYYPVGSTKKYLKLNKNLSHADQNLPYFLSPGYKTSINLLESGLLINIDYAPRILNQKTCYDIIREILCNNNMSSLEKQEKLKEVFEKKSVLASYGSFKLYIVDEIDFNNSPSSQMITYNNKEEQNIYDISLVEYYKKTYKIELKYPNDKPILVSKFYKKDKQTREKIEDPKKVRKLIPELFYITGLDDDMNSINRKMGSNFTDLTKLFPQKRINKVKELIEEFMKENSDKPNYTSPNQISIQWGMDIGIIPLEITGRTLQNPKIKLFDNIEVSATDNGLLKFQSFIAQPQKIKDWILCGTHHGLSNSKDFIHCLLHAGDSFGMKLGNPIQAYSQGDHGDQLIEAAITCLNSTKDIKVEFIVFIIKNRYIYKALKKEFNHNTPILTQVILESTINKDTKKARAICSKIALQMNAKLNFPLWTLVLPSQFPKKTMFVGMDL